MALDVPFADMARERWFNMNKMPKIISTEKRPPSKGMVMRGAGAATKGKKFTRNG